jgi:predicted TIM-barrel fold metal-dependent hydrolase
VIVDANVSLDSRRFPVERALEVLGRSRVTRAIVSADPRSADIENENRYVLRVAKDHDLFPFYYVGGNPWTDTRPDNLELPSGISDYAGIRWHRWVGEGIDRDGRLDEDELAWAVSLMESAEFDAVTAAAAHYNLPIIFEESLGVTLEFVQRYPSVDVIIPHLGARSGGTPNVLRALWDTPNVYLDTSLALLDESVLTRVGTERILFASGFPEGDPELELDKVDRLPISEDAKEGIYGDNVLSLLSHFESL